MKVIGLTGGIASGKSTVSKFLKKQNIPVFDADEVAREGVKKESPCLKKIVAAFGENIVLPNGELDRKALSSIVFNDEKELKKLEAITHLYILSERDKFLEEHSNEDLVVLDVPLLIECGWHKKVDEVWLVALSEKQQIRRAMLRSDIKKEEVVSRIRAQMPLREKEKYATVILDNNKNEKYLKEQIIAALEKIVGGLEGETKKTEKK